LKANRKQAELAIDEADVIFVVDVEEGITPMTMLLLDYYAKFFDLKPVLLAVNKVDNAMREKDAGVL
jgi:GTP-binding protein